MILVNVWCKKEQFTFLQTLLIVVRDCFLHNNFFILQSEIATHFFNKHFLLLKRRFKLFIVIFRTKKILRHLHFVSLACIQLFSIFSFHIFLSGLRTVDRGQVLPTPRLSKIIFIHAASLPLSQFEGPCRVGPRRRVRPPA